MSIQLFSRPVDGSIPVAALLYDDEALLATQQGVGLYDGPTKSPAHQSGSAHVTTHRLFFITDDDAASTGGPDPPYGRGHSLAFPLHVVAETQYYAGFFKSSAKITLALHSPSSTINSNTNDGTSSNPNRKDFSDDLASWECQICAYRNPPGLSPSARSICALCGVPRQQSHSQPAEETRAELDPSPELEAEAELEPIPCAACTFHNHPSLTRCEICGTQLPPHHRPSSRTAPISRPDSPGDDTRPNQAHSIRLSFRKGGDKVFYGHLKRALLGKAWEVNKLSGGTNGNIKTNSSPSDPSPPNQPTNSREGIHHILHTLSTTSTTTSASLSHAFADLEIFMAQARDMVRFAEDLGHKLETLEKRGAAATESPSILGPNTNLNDQNAKATIIRSSLAQLGLQSRLHVSARLSSSATSGLPPPSSAYGDSNGNDRDKDEQAWLAGLARELAVVLQGPGESRRGDPFEQNGNGNTTSRTGLGLPNPSLKLNNVDLSRTDSVAPGREGEGTVGMMRTREIVSLDEVWGAWNRARGVSLIPPPTLLQTLPHLPTHTTPPIHARTLRSGLVVLHTPRYSQEKVVRRFLAAIRRGSGGRGGHTHMLDGTEDGGDMTNSNTLDPLDPGKGLTTPSFAHGERLPISLVADLVLEAEASGVVCRDAGGAGFGLSVGVDADLDSVAVGVGGGGGGGGGAKSTSTGAGVVSKLSAFVGKVGAGAGIGAGGGVDESAYLSTDVRWYVNVWRDYVWDGQV